jgi:hypothetical protein
MNWYRVCGGCEGVAGPGRAKTSSLGRKMVLGLFFGGTADEGEETSGSENETRLVATGLPGREHGGLSRAARRGVRCHAGLKAADGDHLVSRPDLDVEEAGGCAVEPRTGLFRAAEGVE